MEREVGFGDHEGVGFPSIKGCLAIAYQTTSGIFGFHNAGNSGSDKFALRAKKWADWLKQHPNGKDQPLALYGVSFIRRNLRGYDIGKSSVSLWKAEMKTFADHLGFTGPIMGSDLASVFTEPREVSALVEFRKQGRGYGIFVREWYDDATKDGVTKDDWVQSASFTHLDSKPPYMPKKMVTDVSREGMVRVYTERLGGL